MPCTNCWYVLFCDALQYQRITISSSYWIYLGFMMLGSLKYTQLTDQYPSPVLLRLSWLWKSSKDINHQVLITFQQNWFSQEIEKYALRYILTNSSWNVEELSQQCKEVKYCAYWQAMQKYLTVFEISSTLGTYWIQDCCSITTWPQPAHLSDMASNDRMFRMIKGELFYNIIPTMSIREGDKQC